VPISISELIETHKKAFDLCGAERAASRIANEPDLAVIDVREPPEFESASVPNAVNIPRGFLEFRIGEVCSADDHPVLIHCAKGGRAVLAAKTLAEMGYSNIEVVWDTIEDLLAALE